MLDSITRRRIDTARNILVGKVPDPKGQVEQITIALIYKFMDDIDSESERLGGNRKFFTNDFERFRWGQLMRPGIGGQEMLNLYAEALDKVQENPAVPQLFRDIFKNAYLPYRDPETLRAFLKTIDEFEYDHSERLGDAYEYLLSIMSSQGDAGQFRTPRHIIDFMVQIVDPKKDETILDPACGTAGFLISSYKHILEASIDENNKSTFTPDEKSNLASNLTGYDISPDMVRISLTNMYLHNLLSPNIEEYDTLTDDRNWGHHYDIILANPPFMTPKGGIRPHNRFSIKSKRSEALFVDYFMEHLMPNGRSAVIVPEGIVFRNDKAYKQLRKMLVEDHLLAVVALPAGVFKPYSGVKTSILIIDKFLAKKSSHIGYFKVKNDGFDLGDQRKPIAENDLQRVLTDIHNFTMIIRDGLNIATEFTTGFLVLKDIIEESGDYNLNLERYRLQDIKVSAHSLVKLEDICDIRKGTSITKKDTSKGIYPVIAGGRKPSYYHNEYNREGETITISASGAYAGYVNYHSTPIFASDCTTLQVLDNAANSYFLYHALKHQQNRIYELQVGMGQPHVYPKDIREFLIPLPHFDMQEKIAEEILTYEKVITGARTVIQNYKPNIYFDPKWNVINVGDLVKPQYGYTATAQSEGDARYIRITDISNNGMLKSDGSKYISLSESSKKLLLSKGDILVARTGSYGKTMIFEENYPAVFASYLVRLRFPKNEVNPKYFWIYAQSNEYWKQAKTLVSGGVQPQFNGNVIKQLKLPLPSIEMQNSIVKEVECELKIVESNRELILMMERKIDSLIARVWSEEPQSIP